MIRSIKTLRIIARAGSTFKTFTSGMTLSVTRGVFPPLSRIFPTSSAADLFPATTIGQIKPLFDSFLAFSMMTSLFPPSVPPARRMISGRIFSIS
jgi:hypothetical protein